MQAYIATFFTHYDATVFHKLLSSLNISSKMMPVPRKLSSSCGTCVSYQADAGHLEQLDLEAVERLVRVDNEQYIDVIDNR